MSLDSTIWLDTPATAAEIEACLLATGHFERIARGLAADGVAITIGKPSRYIPREAGLNSATLNLFCDCLDSERTSPWTLNTVRALVALLHLSSEDLLFVYSSDYPALLRTGGRIVLDKNVGVWRPEVEPKVLPLIDLPYDWGSLPPL